MQDSLHRRRLAGRARSTARLTSDLAVLLAWLVIFGVGLRLLVGWPAALPLPEQMPSWSVIRVWAQSPGGSLQGLISVAAILAWAIWLWTLASVLLRVAIDLADAFTRGARWVSTLRRASDRLTLPLVRRAVDASLAGLLFARVVAQPGIVSASLLADVPIVAIGRPTADNAGNGAAVMRNTVLVAQGSDKAGPAEGADVIYRVEEGDTLSGIALAFYGDADQAERIYEANVGRQEPGGRQFNRHGLIIPGWTLQIPSASRGVVQEDSGARWYVVKHGDTLTGIAARVLGDEQRYPELFALNVGVAMVSERGPVLRDPNLIWPGLRLRLPDELSAVDAPPPDGAPSTPTTEPAPHEELSSPASAAEIASDQVADGKFSPTRSETPTAVATTLTMAPVAPEQTSTPVGSARLSTPEPTETPQFSRDAVDPKGLAGAGAAAVALAGGALIVRRRKPAPLPTGPETDVHVESGFADADPVEGLARRLAKTTDPPSAVASLMSQAYATIFAEQLTADERQQATTAVSLAGARHGRTATTLMLSAPVQARPYLVRSMRAAAEHAFGKHVDVDGLVSHDGDVLVRLTWDSRRPVPVHVLELVSPESNSSLWATPFLVRLIVGYDRQPIDVNWHTLSNVFLASPTGQGSETPLVALLASLASVRRPEDLGLVLFARPHTLPDEIGLFPHGLADPIDPTDTAGVQHILDDVRQELEHRTAGGASAEQPDLVVVVREICDLEPNAMAQLGVLAAAGPERRVRVVAASERPVAELMKACTFLDDFGTRIVLRTRDEEESIALLGAPRAEELGRGGHALLRLEGRIPIQGWACRVPPENLARLLSLMGTRSARIGVQSDEPALVPEIVDGSADEDACEMVPAEPAASEPVSVTPPSNAKVGESPRRGKGSTASALLQKLRSAPIRVRCLGARDVWSGDRLLELREAELLLLLAAHPVRGIQSEALADMLWEAELSDSERALRVRRSRLRKELRTLVPELNGDPLPGDAAHGERVVVINPEVISSDVHEFLELLLCARKLEGPAAIQAYEEALALYRGDLLDSLDVPNFRWMYDGAQVALTLRSDYRRQQREARLHLAELLAGGPETELARAEELYSSLCAEDPEDERLWMALFQVHERAGSALGLESAVRRLRFALAELAPGEPDVETFPLPPKLDTLVNQIRDRLGSSPVRAG